MGADGSSGGAERDDVEALPLEVLPDDDVESLPLEVLPDALRSSLSTQLGQ